MLATSVNAFKYSEQQNHVHFSLQYNQQSPTWARISQELNSLLRARRSVADQDELRNEEMEAQIFESGQDRAGNLSLRRIRSTPKSPSHYNTNQTTSEAVDLSKHPSKILAENDNNETVLVAESQRSNGKPNVEEKELLASVAQQVSKIVSHKLLPSEGRLMDRSFLFET